MEFLWLSLILILSAVLNFWNLTLEGYGNTYYAAGVKSMLMSFKNFFFVASDPSGFVSIDKPPVGFWLQAVSAKLFGFSGFSIILPQALAGVLSVTLLYFLTSVLCFSASIILYLMIAYKKFLLPQNAMASIKLAASPILRKLVIIIAFIGIISAPTVWSFTPLIYRMNSSSPFAGLELSANGKKAATLSNYSKLIAFLNANRTTEKYLVAIPSASYASDIILESGEPVMTIGGFSGSDKIITLDQFKQLVSAGKLRYALINSDTSRKTDTKAVLLNRKSDNDIVSWIKANGKLVSSNKWQTSKSSHNMKSKGNNTSMPAKLYDLNSAVN